MSDFRTWDQLSETEQYQSIYSDLHKDVFGFRPRGMTSNQWGSLEWLKAEVEDLSAMFTRQMEEEEQERAIAIHVFEGHITELMLDHGLDRTDAIRWIFQANDIDPSDPDYLCYTLNLPYGYIKEVVAIS